MGKEKRYFWFKMGDDFFRKKEIKKLRSIAGGDTYVIIYLKIILLSLQNGGKLYFEGIDDDFISEIALEIDEKKDNVGITLEYLFKHYAILRVEENEYKVNEIDNLIGTETSTAIRVRKHRQKKALLCNKSETTPQQNDNGETDIELELDKEIEIELETDVNIEIEANSKNYLFFLNHWNDLDNTQSHQESTFNRKMQKKHFDAINDYSQIEVEGAMNNYNIVIGDDKYYWSHKWTLFDFLIRGLERFMDSADPLNVFLKDKKEQPVNIQDELKKWDDIGEELSYGSQ